MADKQKDVPKKTPPAVKVEGYVKVTIKGRTETLTMEEAEQLRSQLGAVLKERKEYITLPSYPNWNWGYHPYPYDFTYVSGGGSSSGVSTINTTGYIAHTTDNAKLLTSNGSFDGKVMDFNQGDSIKAGNYTFTFIDQPNHLSKS